METQVLNFNEDKGIVDHVVYCMVVVRLTASGLDGQEVHCCHMAG